MDTTRLRQVEGGTVIKQADRASTMTFILQDSLGREVDLNGQQAQIALYTLDGRYWETKARVDKARVSFNLPGNLSEDDYILDISVAGYVFPSDRDFIIRVVKGYKDLLSKERADKFKKDFEELRQEVEKQTNIKLNKQIEELENIGNKKLGEIEERATSHLESINDQSSNISEHLKQESDEYIKLIGTNSSSVIREIEDKKNSILRNIDNKSKNIENNVKDELKKLLKDKVDKEPGKILTDNNFTNDYKNKIDKFDKDLNKKLEPKADKAMVDDEVQKLKDLIFDNEVKYQDNMAYVLDSYIENGEVKFKAKEIGNLLANDFLKVQVDSDKYRFRIKSTSQGVILFYSMTDKALRYAIHVYPKIKDYEINFGKKVTGEMIFTSVTMPEDKVSVIRKEVAV